MPEIIWPISMQWRSQLPAQREEESVLSHFFANRTRFLSPGQRLRSIGSCILAGRAIRDSAFPCHASLIAVAESYEPNRLRNLASYPYRERLWAGFVRVGARARPPALETSLQQAHQTCVPVPDNEENQKRCREIILV